MLPTFSFFNKVLCIRGMWVGYFSIHKLFCSQSQETTKSHGPENIQVKKYEINKTITYLFYVETLRLEIWHACS